MSREVVAVGSDHAGYILKETLKREIELLGFEVMDLGTDSVESCDYPDFAREVAEAVSEGRASRGVLVCGTGVGMSMVANKVPGIRAAVCNDVFCAEMSRAHNDANILTIGARVVDEATAGDILKKFMETGFEGGTEAGARHVQRLRKLSEVESRYVKGE